MRTAQSETREKEEKLSSKKEKIKLLKEYGQSEVSKRETLEAKIRDNEKNEEVRQGKIIEAE